MRNPKKKCIAKKCEDCQFYQRWDMTDQNGLRKSVKKCSMQVLFEELPHIRGAIDGLQAGVNEARNQAAAAQQLVNVFGNKAVETISVLTNTIQELSDDTQGLQVIKS